MTQTSPQSELVLFEMIGAHVAVVTLNRPDKRNAINVAMAEAIERTVEDIERQIDIRAVVLTSCDPRVFSAGADLAEISAGRGLKLVTPRGGFAGFNEAVRMKPWIAAVEGAALAGGCEICLACDMIVAAETASFGVPEVKRALIAGSGGVHRLPKLIPRNIAIEMITTGDPIDAQRAYQLGLVNHVTPAGSARGAAIALAQRIADNAPIAVQQSLSVARQVIGRDEQESRAIVVAAFPAIFTAEDFKEGPRAFLEKRPPVWTGR